MPLLPAASQSSSAVGAQFWCSALRLICFAHDSHFAFARQGRRKQQSRKELQLPTYARGVVLRLVLLLVVVFTVAHKYNNKSHS